MVKYRQNAALRYAVRLRVVLKYLSQLLVIATHSKNLEALRRRWRPKASRETGQ